MKKSEPPKARAVEDLSMLELFRTEAESQTALLSAGLLALERAPATTEQLEALMRAAHSYKGAARIVNLEAGIAVAHGLEDYFVAAQKNRLTPCQAHINILLRGVDWLADLGKQDDQGLVTWEQRHQAPLEQWRREVRAIIETPSDAFPPIKISSVPASGDTTHFRSAEITPTTRSAESAEAVERYLRLSAENLNRLLALAGETLVESRWLRPFTAQLQRLKRQHTELEATLHRLQYRAPSAPSPAPQELASAAQQTRELARQLEERLQELDQHERRTAQLANRLYLEALRTRMRPFGDGVRHFPRMVRDLAQSLGKQVRFEILGENTQVDRDILERLEAPLTHLLRNAVDHGTEPPALRLEQGKPAEATIRLEARHSAGMLQITLTDDGPGLDAQQVRDAINHRKLIAPSAVEKMSEPELLQFLFLPGFTLRKTVTEISGRGVGLDIVQTMIRSVRGSVRVSTLKGRGMRIQLQLPLTLSVFRALLVEIGGEPYAFPLTQIVNSLKLSRDRILSLEGQPHFRQGDQHIGLVNAQQILDVSFPVEDQAEELALVVLGAANQRYGLQVDRFLGERELVVQPLDPRLGKIKDISAAALMDDGAPVLIVDVEDLLRSIDKFVASGRHTAIPPALLPAAGHREKRILVVEDSLTVRELERKLLEAAGYAADVAVDGMDGWNAVRAGSYDLVITDVDMPRLDGIELTILIKQEERLKLTPVMIVSYKDREEDRLRGLNAGADYYLTKGSFQDATLIQAVADLIGEANQ